MTRDEAMEKLMAETRNACTPGLMEDFIEMSVALGMLKLDEPPKSIREIAIETIQREVQEWNMVRSGSVEPVDVSCSMLMAFNRAGLKIVEK